MDERIIEAADKYRQMALSLQDLDAGDVLDTTIDRDAQAALLALYYAKALQMRIEKCEELLTEESGEDAVETLFAAATAVDEAASSAMDRIEQYAQEERDFEKQLDKVSVSTETESPFIKLLKLYKCESIIRMAYNYASAHSYASAPEEFIARHMDIDIEALLGIRQRLLEEIGKSIGEAP